MVTITMIMTRKYTVERKILISEYVHINSTSLKCVYIMRSELIIPYTICLYEDIKGVNTFMSSNLQCHTIRTIHINLQFRTA